MQCRRQCPFLPGHRRLPLPFPELIPDQAFGTSESGIFSASAAPLP
jgi:hypothetical protein